MRLNFRLSHFYSIENCKDEAGEPFWWTCCAHRVAVIDPIGTVLADMSEHLERSTVSRTKLRVKLTAAGTKAFEKIQTLKVPISAAPTKEAEEKPCPTAVVQAQLSGWTAKHFSRGKKGEENIMKWLMAFPEMFRQAVKEDLLDASGCVEISPKGSKQKLKWVEVACRAPLMFDVLLKGQPTNFGVQVTWKLHSLLPQSGDKASSARGVVLAFCKDVVKSTPPVLPSPEG